MKSDFEKFALSKGIGSNLLDEYNNKCIKDAYIEPTVIEERNVGSMVSVSVFSRLLMDKIIFLGTEINDDVANIIVAQLLWLEQQTDSDITLYINSPGGSVISGYSIIDVCNFIKNKVNVYISRVPKSFQAIHSISFF